MDFCFRRRHQTLDGSTRKWPPSTFSDLTLKLLLHGFTCWTVERNAGDFSRSVTDGCWSLGTSQLCHDADQERRKLAVAGTESRGAPMRLPFESNLIRYLYQPAGSASVDLYLQLMGLLGF